MYHVTRNTYQYTYQSGQILLLVLVFMVVVTSIVVSLVGYAGLQIRSHRQAVAREQGLHIAEAAAELAIWKLNNQAGYNGETSVAYANGTYNVAITNLGNSKLIKVDSYVPSATNPTAHRVVQVTATSGTENIGFNYGVQVDAGGIKLDNNARINGNIYSNGNIIGDTSGVKIAGTAIVGGPTGKIDEIDDIDGDATAHFLEDVSVDGSTSSSSLLRGTVGGNVIADSIADCTIGGNATYDTKTNPCSIGGNQTTPNPTNFTDPQILALPISDEQIQAWKDEAEDGGVVSSQTISGPTSLGPKKINGDLTIDNGATLTMTGNIWVTGDISVDNNAKIILAASYGSLSGVIINDGWSHFDNNGLFAGSGTAGSYLMFLNTSACDGSSSSGCTHHNAAVDLHNNVGAAIMYVKNGLVNLHNSVNVKEITAYKIHMNNTAVVTYESGLANAQFSSGPTGGWQILAGSWQLLQ